jgi:S-DNA-T family DNA segregation ATPase FtsK/SpoIIIE
MTRRKAKPKPKTGPSLEQLLRGEIIGGILVVMAILLMLSLLSSNRGDFTTAIVDGLRELFGVGIWFAPLLLGFFGVWLALRHVTPDAPVWTRRLAGIFGLFLIAESALHILLRDRAIPPSPSVDAGGVVGSVLGQSLEDALGVPVTLALLVLAAAGVFVLIAGWTPTQIGQKLSDGWNGLRGSFRGPDGKNINPPLPLGESSALQRWWRKVTNPNGAMTKPPEVFRPSPTSPASWSKPETPASTPRPSIFSRAPTPATTTPAKTQPSETDMRPRIVGGRGQTWRLPVMADMLEDSSELDIQGEDLRRRAQIIETTLEGFGVPVQVVEANQGPAVTQFGLRPGIIVRKDRKGEEKRIKVRVSQIQQLSNDLSLALAASPIRIEAPVPGRDIVGVEVPNVQISLVALRGVMESEEYRASRGPLVIGLGRDVSGAAAVTDLAKMPHLLIAGATGSGKSVCVNAIITALLLSHTPDTLRFLMIDPKRVELTVYNGIPHLIAPVVVDVERAVPVLLWATREMERRYRLFSKAGARNIESYNEKQATNGEQHLPYIVVMIDELADLMLSAPDEVERHVCRLAQMARATGIHLVIATQRPSVDVVTGLIKANFPARIAFAVTSQIDSRVILDTPGAEQLLGRGDMLFMAPDSSKLSRLQGCFVSDRETQRLVRYWRGARAFVEEGGTEGLPVEGLGSVVASGATGEADGDAAALDGLEPPWLPGQEMLQQPLWTDMAEVEASLSGKDDMYNQAVEEVRKSGRASVSLLQRRLRIGYSRAARLIEQLEADGIVGPDLGGSRGREVLPPDGGQLSAGNQGTAAASRNG